MFNKIICQICLKECNGQLPGLHLKLHGITTKEYEEKFGPARLSELKDYCKKSGSKGGSNANSILSKNNERIANISEYNLNPTICEKCKCSMPYEKRHSKYCNSSCFASHSNSIRPLKIPKQLRLFKPQIWHPGPHFKNCLQCFSLFKVKSLKNPKIFCSHRCSAKYNFSSNKASKKSNINGYKMDSGAESVFANELTQNNIVWIKNDGLKFKKSFEFIDSLGMKRDYYPDFYLPDHNIWVEIKGLRYIRKDDDLRRACVDVPVVLLMCNNFKKELPEFIKKYAK